ncbi:SET domain-containing protein SmydA-8-like [Panulirus ornatus]|uniref:SET domain-containing protein SmydA-8-like n=1 Tax=Panulirus ornatus TaxID=150431 RepID=UPI003A857FE9
MTAVETLSANMSSENCTNCVSEEKADLEGVAIFEKYMCHLLPHNVTWLASPPPWCTDLSLSNETLVSRTKKWAENLSWDTYLPELQSNDGVAPPVKVAVNDVFGRHLVATRSIVPGEVLIVEPPLILSLREKSPPYCSTCYKRAEDFTCPSCGFFLCSAECSTAEHQEECAVLQGLGLGEPTEGGERKREETLIRERLNTMPSEQRAEAQTLFQKAQKAAIQQKHLKILRYYIVVHAVRTLLAMSHSDLKRKIILSLQGNSDKESQRYRVNQKRIVDVLMNELHVATDSTLVHRICSVWDTNGFEVPLGWGTRVHGLYPFASLLTHDCRSNTQQWFTGAGDLVLRAVDHIPQGEVVTTCYTDPQWATMLRQDHLRLSKQFTCTCRRCCDPTELGTFMGSPLCPGCGGPVVSSAPLDPKADWICHSGCPHTATAKEVAGIGAEVGNGLRQLCPTDPAALTALADRLKARLHPTHHILLQLHVSTLRTIANKNLAELSDEEVSTLATIANLVMGVVRLLEAPLTRLTVRVAREDLRLQLEMLRRSRAAGHDTRATLQALSMQVGQCELALGWDTRMPSFLPVLQQYRAMMEAC